MSCCRAPHRIVLSLTTLFLTLVTMASAEQPVMQWVVAFNSQNSLPANVDKIVASAAEKSQFTFR